MDVQAITDIKYLDKRVVSHIWRTRRQNGIPFETAKHPKVNRERRPVF